MIYICYPVWLLPINLSPGETCWKAFYIVVFASYLPELLPVDLPSLLWGSIFDIQYCSYFVSVIWESVGQSLWGFLIKYTFKVNNALFSDTE